MAPAAALRRPDPDLVTRLRELLGVALAATAAEVPREVTDLVVERARRGDHRAFTEIVTWYDDRLRALAYRLLRDRDRMDDVLQEAYMKAFRALPGYRGESSLSTWLFRITYNACMDDLRRTKPTVPLLLEDGVDTASPAPGPAELAVDRDTLAGALAALPPDQRAAVLLVDAYGLDYGEAADVLGVAPGTIGSRLTRARAALRRVLNGGDQ